MDFFLKGFKLVFLLAIYLGAAIWLSGGLCYEFFGWGFWNAPYGALFNFWHELGDVKEFSNIKDDSLRVFAATIIPLIPLIAFMLNKLVDKKKREIRYKELVGFFSDKLKPVLLLTAYIIVSIWVSGGLCFLFFGGDFLDAHFGAVFDFWEEMGGVKGQRLKVIMAILIPLLPPIAILLSDRWGKEELYGSARFAKSSEVAKAGLHSNTGIILGKDKGRFLVADGTEHVLLAAPTRSGKGVSFIIPNLLTWSDSCLVLDIKFENFEVTSNYRKACGQKVFQFSPGQRNTHRWNVFDLVDKDDPARIDTIQTIAHFICPTSPEASDPMWTTEGRNLLTSIILYLFDIGKKVSFGNVRRFILDSTVEDLDDILTSDFEERLDPETRSGFSNFIQMGDKQRGGVKSELTSSLSIFGNPLVDYATSESDFDIRDLKKEKITIYLGATPTSLLKYSQFFNLFFQFFISENTKVLPDEKTEPYKVLLLLDEFPVLGKMDLIKKGIGYFAGYNLRLAIICQGLAQVEDIYNKTGQRSFLTNFKYKEFYAPNDDEDALSISKALGTKTVKNISDSKPSLISIGSGSRSESHSKASRELMMPQEVKMLDRSELLIFVESTQPIKAKKLVYHQDKFFTGKYYDLFDKDGTASRIYPSVPPVVMPSLNKINASSDLELQGEEPRNEGLEEGELNGLNDGEEALSDDQISSLVEQYFFENVDIESYEETSDDEYNPFDVDESYEVSNASEDEYNPLDVDESDEVSSDSEGDENHSKELNAKYKDSSDANFNGESLSDLLLDKIVEK
jgi:type IV secretion system protein VirD4